MCVRLPLVDDVEGAKPRTSREVPWATDNLIFSRGGEISLREDMLGAPIHEEGIDRKFSRTESVRAQTESFRWQRIQQGNQPSVHSTIDGH